MCGESWREKLQSICLGYLSDEPGMGVWHNEYEMGILKFLEGNMNSRKYIDTLDTVASTTEKSWRYMDDNIPYYRSREVET